MLSRATIAKTYRIREMNAKDIPAIVNIEQSSFEAPWSFASFENELKKPFSLCYVSQSNTTVVGYAIAWKIAEEMQIANLAVDARFRRQGIAKDILNMLIGNAIEAHVESIHLEVRKSSAPAIQFYEKLGFRITGERKNYYQSEGISAWLMTKQL